MGLFDPVELHIDFSRQECKILEFWEREKIFDQLVARNRGRAKWSFIDGPITANNPMGVHHAWGRTYKDVFQRYMAMRGFDQRYQNGYDCQGLWLEVETEKDLGFNSKQDIENFGLDEFSRACRARVERHAGIITEQSMRLGQWMDWENSYYTMSDTNIQYIWHFLGACHDRGWLRKGHLVMPWCTRCGTSLSQHELTDSYREIEDSSVFLGFPLKAGVRREGPWLEKLTREWTMGDPPRPSLLPKEGERLLVWTTTPWTLTSNVAAAVSPELAYARVEFEGNVYYVSTGVAEQAFQGKGKVLGEIRGHEMIGWVYEGPFDDLPAQQDVEHVIIPWSEVGETEGSGIVHVAPGCGAEDCQLGKELGLAALAPLDGQGIYIDGFGWLTGKDVHDVEQPIYRDLEKKGILLRAERYQHRYPFCWRCHEKLVFRMEDEWFIRSDEIRPLMKAAARQVNWVPESIGKRTQDWYDNMGDWCISRKRFWGLPLPFYFCPQGHLTIVRSKEQLRQFAVEPEQVDALPELHRPWIDAVRIRCQHEGCGETAERTPDVGDCWMDAGIVPYSTLKYLEDRSYWEAWFPTELVCEMREQVRLWFYAMMFMSVTLENRPPYKAVFSYEKLLDEHGEAMHRSKGNAIWFDEAVEKMGADVMRWYYCAFNPNQNLRFGFATADELRRRLITLWNVYSFLVTYAELDGFDPAADADPAEVGKSPNALDRWILSALYQLVADMRGNLDTFDVTGALRDADRFLDGLSTWYVRRSRRRFWKSESDADKRAAHRTLYHVVLTYARLLAPIVPFVAEAIYRNLTKRVRSAGNQSVLRLGFDGTATPDSVHLTPYPEERPELVDESLNGAMDFVLRTVSLGRAAREKARIKVRQPLARLWVVPLQGKLQMPALAEALHEEMIAQLRDELNVKEVDLSATEVGEFARRAVRLNFAVLGKKYGPQMKELAAKVKAGEHELTSDGGLRVDGFLLSPDEYQLVYEPTGNYTLAHDHYTLAAFDTEITDELRLEGWAREVIRRIQDLRKQAGYQVEDRIRVAYQAASVADAAPGGDSGDVGDAIDGLFSRHNEYIRNETLAVELTAEQADQMDASAEVKLESGPAVRVGVRKANTA
ncbi:MAG: isoleucine--tRNA ligase [Candidatus Eisenbacteria sp.]|nr:isoleucine--tRNA ligase [Candidatus Eisenbacteria bacterium]